MTGPVLRAGAWPAVAGVSGVAVVVGGCGAAFPASGTGGLSSDAVWWTVLTVCVVAIAVSVDGRSLPRWMSGVP